MIFVWNSPAGKNSESPTGELSGNFRIGFHGFGFGLFALFLFSIIAKGFPSKHSQVFRSVVRRTGILILLFQGFLFPLLLLFEFLLSFLVRVMVSGHDSPPQKRTKVTRPVETGLDESDLSNRGEGGRSVPELRLPSAHGLRYLCR